MLLISYKIICRFEPLWLDKNDLNIFGKWRITTCARHATWVHQWKIKFIFFVLRENTVSFWFKITDRTVQSAILQHRTMEKKHKGWLDCMQHTHICFRSSINTSVVRERVRWGWGGGEAALIIWAASVVKGIGIAFITVPKWNSRGWLPVWRREEMSWIALCREKEWRRRRREKAPCLYFPDKTPNKCGCVTEC